MQLDQTLDERKPKAEPPLLRSRVLSAWAKVSNSRGIISGAIPTPVSRTVRTASGPSARETSAATEIVTLPPRAVNLAAFWSRFPTVWVSRVRSPYSHTSSGPASTSRSTPLSANTVR